MCTMIMRVRGKDSMYSSFGDFPMKGIPAIGVVDFQMAVCVETEIGRWHYFHVARVLRSLDHPWQYFIDGISSTIYRRTVIITLASIPKNKYD